MCGEQTLNGKTAKLARRVAAAQRKKGYSPSVDRIKRELCMGSHKQKGARREWARRVILGAG